MRSKWPLVKLGELLTPSRHRIEINPLGIYKQVTVKLHHKGVVIREEINGSTIKSKQYRAGVGQFIISRIDARNGAMGLIPPKLDGAIVTNDFLTYDVNENKLVPKYFDCLTSTEVFVKECIKASEGTTNRVRLQPDKFVNIETALPPLSEQKRIVARIEELTTQIGEAKSLRKQAAEAAEVVMTCASAQAYDRAAGVSGMKRLDDLCRQITDGTHSTPRYIAEGVPFLSVKDITSGRISFADAKYISAEEHAELARRCNPKRGDVLLTKVGTTGFAKVIDVDREFSIFVSLALLKLKLDQLNPQFAEFMLNSSRLREHSAADTRGVGNKNLVLKFIREFPMPTPPLHEQRRIVAELDALQAEVDKLKRLQSETAAEMDALLPSILDKAFKGEL